jgi:hypothetical protein
LKIIGDPLSEADWSRFDIYAPHVRKLENQYRLNGSYSSILSQGLSRSPHHALLPKLDYIDWTAYRQEDFKSLSHLLTPSITKLHIRLVSDYPFKKDLQEPSECDLFAERIRLSCLFITDLETAGLPMFGVAPPELVTALGSAFSTIFTSHTGIQTLTMEQEVFTSLANSMPPLPYLQSIHLEARGIAPITSPSAFSSSPKYTFPSLRKASGGIAWKETIFWSLFLPTYGHTLHHLDLSQNTGAPPNIPAPALADLFTTIGSSCPILQTFNSILSVSDENTDILVGLIRPLYKCRRLTHLQILNWRTFDISSTLTEEDMTTIPLAWPYLHTFHLGIQLRSNLAPLHLFTPPTLTLSALHILTTTCPNLTSLKLSLNAEHTPSSPPFLSSSSLQNLDLGGSWIKGNIYTVAAWLGDVCPARSITYMDGGKCREWAIVKKTVRVIQDARRGDRGTIDRLREEVEVLREEIRVLKALLD